MRVWCRRTLLLVNSVQAMTSKLLFTITVLSVVVTTNTSLAVASSSFKTVPSIQRQTCATLENSKKALDAKFVERKNKAFTALDVAFSRISTIEDTAQNALAEIQAKRSEKLAATFALLEKETPSSSIRAHVFESTITALLTEERTRIASATSDAQSALGRAYKDRKEGMMSAIAQYKSSVDTAFTKAQLACAKGSLTTADRATLRTSIADAKQVFLATIAPLPKLDEVAISAKKRALQTITDAQDTFRSKSTEAVKAFKSGR